MKHVSANITIKDCIAMQLLGSGLSVFRWTVLPVSICVPYIESDIRVRKMASLATQIIFEAQRKK